MRTGGNTASFPTRTSPRSRAARFRDGRVKEIGFLMRRTAQGALALSVGILVLSIDTSYGSCENADRLVTNKAVDTRPDEMLPFFQASRQFLVQHVTQDDPSAKSATGHHIDFIQLDHYGPFPFTALPREYNAAITKFNRRTLETYGLLPWEIGVYSKKLTDAFRDHNWGEVKLNAAILAHYVNAAH